MFEHWINFATMQMCFVHKFKDAEFTTQIWPDSFLPRATWLMGIVVFMCISNKNYMKSTLMATN